MNTMLKVSNLQVQLGHKQILKGCNLDVTPKTFTGILGPNGAGKSTLLKSIMSFLPYSGTIEYNNKNINSFSIRERAKIFAWIPQLFEPVEGISVEEFILLGRNPYLTMGKIKDEDLDFCEKVIKMLELDKFLGRDISTLSGGEYQKVMIARGLAQDPAILILDEPAAHLDIKVQIEVLEKLRKILLEEHVFSLRGIVATFHDINLAATFCDFLHLLKVGEIKAQGPAREILNRNMIKDIFGGYLEPWHL